MSALSLSSIIKLIQKSKYGVTCGRLAAFSIAPVRFNVVACNGDVALCIQGSPTVCCEATLVVIEGINLG